MRTESLMELERRLTELQTTKRMELANKVKAARNMECELIDNPVYAAAKVEMMRNEAEIDALREQISLLKGKTDAILLDRKCTFMSKNSK